MQKLIKVTGLLSIAGKLMAENVKLSYFPYSGQDKRFEKEINPTNEYYNPIHQIVGLSPDREYIVTSTGHADINASNISTIKTVGFIGNVFGLYNTGK